MKGFRTFFHAAWIGLLGAALACYDQLSVLGLDLKSVVGDFVPVKYVGVAVIGIAFLFTYLRTVTDTEPCRRD